MDVIHCNYAGLEQGTWLLFDEHEQSLATDSEYKTPHTILMDGAYCSSNMYVNIDIVVLHRSYNYHYPNSNYIVILKDTLSLFEYSYIAL